MCYNYIMHNTQDRYATYTRATAYFIAYSVILFLTTNAYFLQLKTPPYFFLGFAISGAVAVLFMDIQYKMENRLNPNFWILNIFIEVVGYYIYTYIMFYLFYLM